MGSVDIQPGASVTGEGVVNVMELFAGAGGGIYGGLLLGHTPVCAVEIVAKNREILLQRQRDGIMPRFPIWDDVRTFDGLPWRGIVDVVSGGFPCADISAAGKGAGIDGEQSGLWREMARIVREVRPRYVFLENSPMLITRGIGRVLGDLASIGYDCRWTCLSAAECGAPHKRDRVWILADSERNGRGQGRMRGSSALRQDWSSEGFSDSTSERCGETRELRRDESEEWPCRFRASNSDAERGGWPPEPGVGRVVDGVADWKHRIFALGNGQVPRVHAAAWRMLTQTNMADIEVARMLERFAKSTRENR